MVYAANDVHGAFIETFGRDLAGRVVREAELLGRGLARIVVRRSLRLVDLSGEGLARVGADGRLCTGDYATAQRWALAIWAHPERPDGLAWRSRFDPSRRCVAIYDRAADAVTADEFGRLTDPRHALVLRDVLNAYGFALA